jgi:hypothetical protein
MTQQNIETIERQNKDQEHCDCIFCVSKCPACKSTNVRVRANKDFWCENDGKGLITIDSEFAYIEMNCEDCGDSFSSFDGELNELQYALGSIMQGDLEVKHENGEITVTEALRPAIVDNWASQS